MEIEDESVSSGAMLFLQFFIFLSRTEHQISPLCPCCLSAKKKISYFCENTAIFFMNHLNAG